MKVVYATRTGRLLTLPEEAANDLADDRLPDEGLLPLLRECELVVADEDEFEVLTGRSEAGGDSTGRRSFVLMPTAYCNMGCEYCGQAHSRTHLGREHRSVVADRVKTAIASPGVETVSVSWFGGEPMAGYPAIRQMGREFVAEAEREGVTYDSLIVTNGSLLTVEKMVELHVHCKVRQFEVTIDGSGEIHDTHRPLKSGKGSFHSIVETLLEALAHPDMAQVAIGLRTNVDQRNIDHIDEYIDTMAALGFTDPRVRFHFAFVHPWFNDVTDLELAPERYAEKEAGWLRRLLRHGMHFDILPGGAVQNVCTATTRSSEVVSPTGAVFSCTEEPLVPALEASGGLSKVTDLGLPELRPRGPYDDWPQERRSYPCATCVMLGVCGGYCPKSWKQDEGVCPSFKLNVQERMELAAELGGLTPV